MKKLLLPTLLLTLFLISCGTDVSKQEANHDDETTIESTTKIEPIEDDLPQTVIKGTWLGEMNNKKLTIVIEEVNGDELIGYNILGSNKRSIKGKFTEGSWDQPCSKAYQATLNEPGDDEWDGVFTVKFVGYEDEKETEDGLDCAGNLHGHEAMGDWKSNNKKSEHTFMLMKEE